MGNLNPFEVRLELLKMAKELLLDDYYGERERISNDWNTRVGFAMDNKMVPPEHPGFPKSPSEEDIIRKAEKLNAFVSKNG